MRGGPGSDRYDLCVAFGSSLTLSSSQPLQREDLRHFSFDWDFSPLLFGAATRIEEDELLVFARFRSPSFGWHTSQED